MKLIDCAQRSPEWHAARVGQLTSSCAAEMLTTRKDNKESAARRNLRVRLALERLLGRSIESTYQSFAMEQGIAREADACTLYEAATGRLLRTVGFVAHDTLAAGCSPDGYVNDFEGIVECKCPIPATHLEYLRTGIVPEDYLRQVQHHLWITGAQWCDWLSFNPDFPEPLQVRLVRVERDDSAIAEYEKKARAFLAEVDREVEAVETMANMGGVMREVVGA